MPLRARKDDEDILSFLLTEEEWATLKKSYRKWNLRLPCCNSKAIPKTSKLGNYFFAHARRGDCASSGPESWEHISIKTAVARAAIEAGWNVTTEKQGSTPDGKRWIADVMCEQGDRKIAFEAQWSPQTDEVTLERQQIYHDSGVECVWFMKSCGEKIRRLQEGYYAAGVIPAFHVYFARENKGIVVFGFNVSLEQFVDQYLSGNVQWGPLDGEEISAEIVILPHECSRCKNNIGIAAGLLLSDQDGIELDFLKVTKPPIAELINTYLTEEKRAENKVGDFKIFRNCLSNTCFYCKNYIVDNFYWNMSSNYDLLKKQYRVFSFPLLLGKDIHNYYSTWKCGSIRTMNMALTKSRRKQADLHNGLSRLFGKDDIDIEIPHDFGVMDRVNMKKTNRQAITEDIAEPKPLPMNTDLNENARLVRYFIEKQQERN